MFNSQNSLAKDILYQTSGQSADLVLVFSTVIYYHIIYRGIPEAYPIPPVNYSASISNRYESLQKKFTMQKKIISFLAEEKNSVTISVPGSILLLSWVRDIYWNLAIPLH